MSEEQIEEQAVSEGNISSEESQDKPPTNDRTPPADPASGDTSGTEDDFEDMDLIGN